MPQHIGGHPLFFAKLSAGRDLQWDFRDDRNPMVAFLPFDRDMRVSRAYGIAAKEISPCPCTLLLEAEERPALFSQEAGHEINPQTDRIDVSRWQG